MHIDTARSDDWRVDYDGYLKSVPSVPQAQAVTDREDDEDYEEPYDYRPSMAPQVPPCQLTEGAPPIPVRNPTAKRSTQPCNRPVATGRKQVIPAANCMASVISELTKFNVRDDSARVTPAARPPIVVVSPQPTVPPATLPSRVNRTQSSSQAARPGSTAHARIAGRPSDRPTQTPAQVRPIRTVPPTVGGPDTDITRKDVRELSTEEVSACLKLLKMSEHVGDFADKEVDGEMLSCLDETILVDEFHFSGFNAIKLMKFVKEGYVPRTGTNT